MDDEKSLLEKVKDTAAALVDSIVNPETGTSIDMPHNESGAEIERAASTKKRRAKKVPSPDPERVAGTTNEQVYIPEATDAAATPAPLFSKKRGAALVRANKRVAKPKKAPPKKAKKSAKKTAKKPPKKAKKTTAKKNAKKVSRKKAVKRRR